MGDSECLSWKGMVLIQYNLVMTNGCVYSINTCLYRAKQDLVTEGRISNRLSLHTASSLSRLNV
ncbi:hypothetical protein PMIT1323_01896 [Prochlorococcus marinus str. MIT 1323]|nr:hypothetical protein PMIT1323_01896 [Prochlorococcus marinus str. MIT 1323]